jgi:hypothetical protein
MWPGHDRHGSVFRSLFENRDLFSKLPLLRHWPGPEETKEAQQLDRSLHGGRTWGQLAVSQWVWSSVSRVVHAGPALASSRGRRVKGGGNCALVCDFSII